MPGTRGQSFPFVVLSHMPLLHACSLLLGLVLVLVASLFDSQLRWQAF
jgi:hypothetical protein